MIDSEIGEPQVPYYKFHVPPKPLGKWSFDEIDQGVFFYVPFYPNAFHRFMQRWLLGIKWERVDD